MKPTDQISVNHTNRKTGMFFTLTISIVIVLTVCKNANSQDAIFSQFYANPLYLNPAFAGSKHCTRLILNYRNQPFPVFGTYSTYSFSADTYSERLSGGLGFNILHDSNGGLLGQTQVGGMYAWQSRLSGNWNLSLGIQASYMNHRIYDENLIFPDQNNFQGNNNLTSGELLDQSMSSHSADFSTGVLIYSEKFYAGAAVHHLNQPSISIYDDENLDIKYSIMMGYEHAVDVRPGSGSSGFSVSPNIIIQSQSGFLRFNYGMYASLSNLTAGLWFRHNLQHPNTLIFTFGIKQVNYAIGYSYDYSLSGFSGPTSGAHELGVLLNFNCAGPNVKYRILNCPTF